MLDDPEDEIKRLRAEAARALRLARGVSDTNDSQRLEEYAGELQREAQWLLGRDGSISPERLAAD